MISYSEKDLFVNYVIAGFMYYILIGPPGSGKGTQSSRLTQHLRAAHISTGNLFRECANHDSLIGKKIQECISQGNLVSDDLVLELLQTKLQTLHPDTPCILDGFPRTLYQAKAFDSYLNDRHIPATILVLDLSDDVIINRLLSRATCLQCGYSTQMPHVDHTTLCPKCHSTLTRRSDDNEIVIRNRLDTYNKQTAPIIDYYKNTRHVCFIDGDDTEDNVFLRIRNALHSQKV